VDNRVYPVGSEKLPDCPFQTGGVLNNRNFRLCRFRQGGVFAAEVENTLRLRGPVKTGGDTAAQFTRGGVGNAPYRIDPFPGSAGAYQNIHWYFPKKFNSITLNRVSYF
jgi:hypothetical protein